MGLQGGSITVICGPMFAGKTKRLIEHVDRWRRVPNVSTCLVKHPRDTRSPDRMVRTHDGKTRQADLVAGDMRTVLGFVQDYNVKVVAIDEAQFFPDLKIGAENLARLGVKVYVAGLDANFLNHPYEEAFEQMASLLPRAEIIEKRLAKCSFCPHNAAFCYKRNPDLGNGTTDLIGGADKYAPTCRKCYQDNKEAIACGARLPGDPDPDDWELDNGLDQEMICEQEEIFLAEAAQAAEEKSQKGAEAQETKAEGQQQYKPRTAKSLPMEQPNKKEFPAIAKQHSIQLIASPNKKEVSV